MTVAVITAENGIPVPGVAKIVGLTMTIYAIVKNVVTPAAISVRSAGRDTAAVIQRTLQSVPIETPAP